MGLEIKEDILFVANYFPPIGGPGTYRPYFLVKHLLPKLDAIQVITTDNDPYYGTDNSLPPLTVEKVKITRLSHKGWDTFKSIFGKLKLLGLMSFIFWPWLWERQAVWGKRLERYLKAHRYEMPYKLYVTTGPFSAGLAVWRYARYTESMFVIDMRDPFTLSPARRWLSKYHYRKFEKLEEQILRDAGGIAVVSPTMRTDLLHKYPNLSPEKVHVVLNGFDGTVQEVVNKVRQQPPFTAGPTKIVYAGSLIDWDGKERPQQKRAAFLPFQRDDYHMYYRSPYFLVKGLGIVHQKTNLKGKIKIDFYGASHLPNTQKLIKNLGLEGVVELHGKIPYQAVKEKMEQADWLFFPMEEKRDGGRSCFMSGKIYEYLHAGKPVLCIGQENDVTALLDDIGWQYTRAKSDAEDVAKVVEDILGKRQNVSPFRINEEALAKCTRAYQADQMLEILEG